MSLEIAYCRNCGDMILHDAGMCTRCTHQKKGTVVRPGDIPVRCPCCSSFFYFPSGHQIHNRHQLSLPLPPIVEPKFCDDCGDYEVHSDGKCISCSARTIHPEVSGEEEVV